jgi:hypothetical protein
VFESDKKLSRSTFLPYRPNFFYKSCTNIREREKKVRKIKNKFFKQEATEEAVNKKEVTV